jgi:signal transduction histidine kinase
MMISSSDIRSAKILVVDDRAANVSLLERILSGGGYTCVTSTMDPRSVCELHRNHRYDLIILDLLMPGMDGFQVMEGLKEIENASYLPVLVITAQPDHKLRALQAGAKDFISKPIDMAEVLTRVYNMLEVRLLHVEAKDNSTVLEQTVERLMEVERLKNGFLSTVSHELRTPLTSIRGSLGLLASGALGALPEEVVEVVAIAERNAVRLIALINDILDLERLETGTIELQFAQVSVESIVVRAMESLATFGQRHGVTVEAPEVAATIWADADRIVQVLVNLLSNAVKFSPPGGVVAIGVGRQESWVEFRVTDHGRGVPVAHRRTIFERFRQVETSDAREKGGTGLGLAICKSIVEQHGGTIGVESEEGDGSTFWFRVATALSPAAPRPGPAVLICGDDADRRGFEHVLRQAGYNPVVTVPNANAAWGALQSGCVVEDDLTLLDVTARQLSREGITVRTATTGEEAIRIAEAEPPALIVLDIGLPERDGFDVVEAMRQRAELKGVPVLVYTARDLTEEQRGRLRLGPTRFLTKSKASDEDFRRLVVELRRISMSRGVETVRLS